jgi:hypothetical protein
MLARIPLIDAPALHESSSQRPPGSLCWIGPEGATNPRTVPMLLLVRSSDRVDADRYRGLLLPDIMGSALPRRGRGPRVLATEVLLLDAWSGHAEMVAASIELQSCR